MSEQQYKHWRMETDQDNILWLYIDRAGAPVNSLSRQVFDEFDKVLDQIKATNPVAVILASGKKKGFIAGADVTQFTELRDSGEGYSLIRQAQLVLDKLEALPMPTVAMISGFCLGGGCEVVLACKYRIAEDIPSTLIGLPEVKLGIQPGWGGTVRLPRLIGAVEAMKIMLPGKAVNAYKAKKLGIVDACVPTRELKRAARYYALNKPPLHKPKGMAAWSNAAWVRPMLGKMLLKNLRGQAREDHYPAPYAIVRNWMKEGVANSAYETEAKSISKLFLTNTARNLLRVFFMQNRLKSLGKASDFRPQHVHVVGAGTMGGDIAAWCAYKGMYVTLQDQSPERIAPAIKRAHKLYSKKLRQPRLIQAVMDRLQPDIAGDGIKRADVVIEAIFEDLSVKQELFKKIETQLKPGAIMATNTSSIPLDEIALVLKDPSRLVGIHFFNPVAKMQLVEVVHAKNTNKDVVNAALSFVGQISRLPLPVTATPGFLVNRVLMPYLLEAMDILEEGIDPVQIDKAAKDFGMPMGPITLADTVGLDICLSVAKILTRYFGGSVPEKLEEMVKAGKLGVKSGKGFYSYKNGKKVKSGQSGRSAPMQEISDRMILRMLNEAITCWDEKVVDDTDLLDVGMIFGTGFAPFRGGPVQYAKDRGIQDVVDTLTKFSKKYGDRFAPAKAWQKLLTNGSHKGVESEIETSNNTKQPKEVHEST